MVNQGGLIEIMKPPAQLGIGLSSMFFGYLRDRKITGSGFLLSLVE